MRIPRFYHPEPLNVEEYVILNSPAAHHCATVLRLKAGESIVLFNGTGKEFACEIADISKRSVKVEVQTELHIDPQSSLNLHLAQGVSKGDRMEWVLQKATELGVAEITPIVTERCNVKLDETRWQKKRLQWHKVIVGACEQSGRNTLPVLNAPLTLREFSAASTTQIRLTLSPTAQQGFDSMSSSYSPQGFRLLIGPEGGLSDSELHLLRESGYQEVRFGPRILRTETAAIAALAILQHHSGDLI